MDIPVVEKEIDLTELYIADEAFASGTSALVTPIKEIDKRIIAGGEVGPITQLCIKNIATFFMGRIRSTFICLLCCATFKLFRIKTETPDESRSSVGWNLIRNKRHSAIPVVSEKMPIHVEDVFCAGKRIEISSELIYIRESLFSHKGRAASAIKKTVFNVCTT